MKHNVDFDSAFLIKLEVLDPELKEYVRAFEKENLRLHNIIAKYRVENKSLHNEITSLKKTPTKIVRIHNLAKDKKTVKK